MVLTISDLVMCRLLSWSSVKMLKFSGFAPSDHRCSMWFRRAGLAMAEFMSWEKLRLEFSEISDVDRIELSLSRSRAFKGLAWWVLYLDCGKMVLLKKVRFRIFALSRSDVYLTPSSFRVGIKVWFALYSFLAVPKRSLSNSSLICYSAASLTSARDLQ